MLYKKHFLILSSYVIFITFQCFSQMSVTGNIIDNDTGNPIPHVEVFISGTTSGCITNNQGDFTLSVPFFPCTLIADHVSYDSYILALEKKEELYIKLNPTNLLLHPINVSARNKRKRNLRFFYSHFIPENQSKIKVLNDTVLVFHRDRMKFVASSNEQLVLINNFLGYKIKAVIKEFEVISLDEPGGKPIPLNSAFGGEVMQLTAFYYYEPLEDKYPDKRDYYIKNRQNSYYGSYRHFLKSIYDQEPENQGYRMEIIPAETEAAFFEIENPEPENSKDYVILAEKIKVFYRFDDDGLPIPEKYLSNRYTFTEREFHIYPGKEPFTIRANGTSPKLTFVINGLKVARSFANSLPEDYKPVKN